MKIARIVGLVGALASFAGFGGSAFADEAAVKQCLKPADNNGPVALVFVESPDLPYIIASAFQREDGWTVRYCPERSVLANIKKGNFLGDLLKNGIAVAIDEVNTYAEHYVLPYLARVSGRGGPPPAPFRVPMCHRGSDDPVRRFPDPFIQNACAQYRKGARPLVVATSALMNLKEASKDCDRFKRGIQLVNEALGAFPRDKDKVTGDLERCIREFLPDQEKTGDPELICKTKLDTPTGCNPSGLTQRLLSARS